MATICLVTPGTAAWLNGERLIVRTPPADDAPDGTEHQIHLRDIETVILGSRADLSIPALASLLRRGIPVLIASSTHAVIGVCAPPAPRSAARLRQYERTRDPAFVLTIARSLVRAKILNERRVLQRLASARAGVNVSAALADLDTLASKAAVAESLDVLRGCEGAAAGHYFDAFGRFFPDDCPFERRSRQPPHNPPNAILSYAYSLLAAELETELLAAGLDPSVGFLHETEDRRPSLALDLLEPFRAPVADALALDLLGHQTLQPDRHFEPREGGIYMNLDGRRRFLVAYERRMSREFLSRQTGQRTTLRGELRRAALGLKAAIVDNQPFEPFQMN